MFFINCFRSCCKTRTFEPTFAPEDLALGERVVQEVNQTAVSSHDIISRVAIGRIPKDQHEARYKEFGPTYLEYLEYLERLHAVRTTRQKVPHHGLTSPQTADFIATTHFGVGECQEKTELTALKVSEANRRFVTISCDGERDGHEFVILGVAAERLIALCNKHDWKLIDTLSACKTGVVVDPYFRLSCPASKIKECRDFVAYMDRFGVEKIEKILPSARSCPTELIWKEVRTVYNKTKGLIPKNLDPSYDPHALAFMRKTKADLIERMKQRHSSLPSVISEINKNPTVTELIRLEIRMAIAANFPNGVLESITDYVVSPFKGLRSTSPF